MRTLLIVVWYTAKDGDEKSATMRSPEVKIGDGDKTSKDEKSASEAADGGKGSKEEKDGDKTEIEEVEAKRGTEGSATDQDKSFVPYVYIYMTWN